MMNMEKLAETVCGFALPSAWAGLNKPVRPNKKRISAEDIKGLYEHQVTINGVVLDCYFDHEEGFDGNDDEPSYPAKTTLIHALADGALVTGLLNEDDIEQCETEALAGMATSRANDDYDRADNAWQARQEERLAS